MSCEGCAAHILSVTDITGTLLGEDGSRKPQVTGGEQLGSTALEPLSPSRGGEDAQKSGHLLPLRQALGCVETDLILINAKHPRRQPRGCFPHPSRANALCFRSTT